MGLPAEVKPPHCPHCNTEMPTIDLFNWMMGAWLILEAHCSTCKKSLTFQIVPVDTSALSAGQPPQRQRIVS